MVQQMSESQKQNPANTETPSESSGQAQVVIQDLPVQIDPSLRTVWVDSMNLQGYLESRTTTLYFHTAVLYPIDSMRRQEVARLQMTVGHACKMIDVMAQHFNYYPKRTDKSKKDLKDAKK